MNIRPLVLLALVAARAPDVGAQAGDFDTWLGYETRAFAGQYSFPHDLEVADFNGDGYPDAAVANWWETSDISVLLGAGDGTFSAAIQYSQSEPSKALLSGDFDGDGDLDIVACNTGKDWDGQTVALHRNRGDGTFETAVNFPALLGPAGLTSGDFNNDGRLDLAVVGYSFGGQGDLAILYANNSGGFLPPVTQTAHAYSYRLDTADFNQDGWLDLVIARDNNLLSLSLGSAAGFGPLSELAAGGGPLGTTAFPNVQITDLDLDGDLDLLYSSSATGLPQQGQSAGSFRVLYNDGLANFSGVTDIPLPPFIGGAVASFMNDLNGDGHPDLLSVHGNNRVWTPLLSDGAGGFVPGPKLAAGRVPVDIASADVDLDGLQDVLVISRDSNGLIVHRNRGAAGFEPHVTTQVFDWAWEIDAGDVDLDGDVDLVTVADYALSGTVRYSSNNGDGSFATSLLVHQGEAPQSVKLRDLNGDGALDLLWSDAGGISGTYDFWTAINNGSGGFSTPIEWPVGTCAAGDVDAFDMDADGDLDVFLTEFGSCGGGGNPNYVYISENLGSGLFAPAVREVAWSSPSIAAADLNADGHLDFIVAGGAGPEVHLGHGDGTFDAGQDHPVVGGAWPLATGDLDGDGIPDLVSSTTTDEGHILSVSIGIGDGTFAAPVAYNGVFTQLLHNGRYLMLEDVDGDFDLDILTVNGPNGDLSLWRNRGDGTFLPHVRIGAGITISDAAFADFDGDGVGDLVAARQLPPAQLDAELVFLPGLAQALQPTTYCNAKLNSLGQLPELGWEGTASAFAGDFRFVVSQAIPNKPGIGIQSTAGPASMPFFGGTLCLQTPVQRLGVVVLDAVGTVRMQFDVEPSLVGSTHWFQFWYRDPAHTDATGVGLTQGLAVTFSD